MLLCLLNFYQPGSFKKTHDGPSLSGIISDHWHELSSDDQRYWYQKADERIPPRKINKPKKLPRAPNCFILFRRHYVHNIHQRGSLSPTGPRLSKIIGELWKRLPPDEKNIWKRKAKDEAERSKLSELQFGYQDRDHAKDSSSDRTRGHNTSSSSGQPMRTSQIPRLLPQEVQSYNSLASLPTVLQIGTSMLPGDLDLAWMFRIRWTVSERRDHQTIN
ncbi:hypothetical protein EV360DRAFT_72028 [Lentinula raphanica]|nr:hypothetical protein EV360DRAFT_72028 [Lentinula raphanica]